MIRVRTEAIKGEGEKKGKGSKKRRRKGIHRRKINQRERVRVTSLERESYLL